MLSAMLAAALIVAPGFDHDPGFEHVRTANRHVREVIKDLAAQSTTFAALLARLDRTNVGVYVQFVARLPASRHGHLQFIAASGDFRFVRIQIKSGLPYDQMAASLAHEIWHAIEIGEHGEVRCAQTMEKLYQRIGYGRSERLKRRYETSAAIAAGTRVRSDVLGP